MQQSLFLLCALILTSASAFACGPYDRMYSADEYTTFRIFADAKCVGTDDEAGQEQFRKENISLWKKLTSASIPDADVDDVVYAWSTDRLALLLKAAQGKRINVAELNALRENAFAQWIIDHRDTETAQYLLLAKDCERVMESQKSLWYYHVDGNGQTIQLTEIARHNAASHRRGRLADRYVLLQIRALFASRHYEECVDVWKARKHLLRPGILRDKAEGYVAGALAKTGKTSLAMDMFARLKDYKSLAYIGAGHSPLTRLEYIARHWPDEEYTLRLLQQTINNVEVSECSRGGAQFSITDDYGRILKTVRRVLRCRRVRRMAAWHYAAAFLEDKVGHRKSALSHLRKAQYYKASAELKDAVRILAIYTRVKYAKGYDDEMERWLLGELTWLDRKMKADITPQVRQTFSQKAIWSTKAGVSIYYWNDMLRKIALGQVVPLCVKSGYRVRALQYANMGENRMFALLDSIGGMSVNKYRSSQTSANLLDYQNDYFLNLDSLGVRSVVRLIYRMRHPQSPADRFLLSHGYTELQYLYDIAGTQMIASMQYEKAVGYLSKVTAGFQTSRNIFKQGDAGWNDCCYSLEDYSTRDPFDPKRTKRQRRDVLYKLHFARKMAALEQTMRHAKDRNCRAEAMLTYVAGLENSVTRCWVLTGYYRGGWVRYPMYSREYTQRISHIVRRSRRMKQMALRTFTDRERAARACCRIALFRTAAMRYPETRMGRLVRGKCDVLRDYTALSGVNYRR